MSTKVASHTLDNVIFFQLFGIPIHAILCYATCFCQLFISNSVVFHNKPNYNLPLSPCRNQPAF